MQSRIVKDMSNKDYHACNDFSSSQIKAQLKSSAHFKLAILNGGGGETKSKNLGTAVHSLILEPQNFTKDVAVCPEINKKTKKGREQFQIFCAENSDKTIINQSDYEIAKKASDSGRQHPWFDNLLWNNEIVVEPSIFFKDDEFGISCRIRPDLMIEPCGNFPNGFLLDVKTTIDASDRAFSSTCAKYRYDLSAAMYQEGFKNHFGTEDYPSFYFLAIETSAPYGCRIYKASDQMLEIGRRDYRQALEDISMSFFLNKWEGYTTEVEELELPYYMQ